MIFLAALTIKAKRLLKFFRKKIFRVPKRGATKATKIGLKKIPRTPSPLNMHFYRSQIYIFLKPYFMESQPLNAKFARIKSPLFGYFTRKVSRKQRLLNVISFSRTQRPYNFVIFKDFL